MRHEILADVDDIKLVASEVEEFMRARPNASETLESITRWWLQHHIEQQLSIVETAIVTLVSRGVVESRQNRSGKTVYVLRRESVGDSES